MPKPAETPKTKGFTLVEMLIAASIFVVVAVSIYSAFQTGMFGYSRINTTLSVYQNASLIFDRIDTDLRNCFAYTENKTNFSGTKSELRFFSLVSGFSGGIPVRNFSFIDYKMDKDKLLRLCRINKESLNDASEIKPEEMASKIDGISFSYGYMPEADQPLVWKDTWDEPKALPDAVKIKLNVKDKIQKEFQRTVYIPAKPAKQK
ncbi:MAG: prepilin-type N-terminal cleavage/methylation domain-containing protein [Candidatus Omnitrophica bacterium]|nr:prepilin-type N-terminal cleavage/methylation domain-containing protein [Candidatus Omnitrophota bacterium]